MVGLAGAVKEMVYPKVPKNMAYTVHLLQLVIVFVDTVLEEMEDKTKATYQNLSISGPEICYEQYSAWE